MIYNKFFLRSINHVRGDKVVLIGSMNDEVKRGKEGKGWEGKGREGKE